MPEDEKTPIDQLLDALVYAPLGIAMTVRDELPRLVEKGRSRVTGQVGMAKIMGQFAVHAGQKEAERLLKDTVDRLGDVIPGARPTPSPPASPPAPTKTSTPPTVASRPAPAESRRPKSAGSERASGSEPRPSGDDLAIPGYDSLSASQVVQRLAGLAPDELVAVESYESATRRRRTILSRVAQLRAG